MSKLPVLFVTCNSESLDLNDHVVSGPARMVWGRSYQSVVLISTNQCIVVPRVVPMKGSGVNAETMCDLLKGQGFVPEVKARTGQSRDKLLAVLLAKKPESISELELNTGMSELEYRKVGKCLEVLRDQGVLLICLDDKTGHTGDERASLDNRHLREMLNTWVDDQRWGEAMSFKGEPKHAAPAIRLDDPTICLLNAAFTLGGSQFPQRMFSTGMNKVNQTLSGFGWMK
ncbi:MAG: hypothetical protein ABJM19_09185 [Marinobacter sp.]|uniref:hypothetical protein n=1 Tax=Marinobacter sp. TaxID=50741 RepID=UPI002B26585D|nr:hypothetical protein [Marinobacter sp.]